MNQVIENQWINVDLNYMLGYYFQHFITTKLNCNESLGTKIFIDFFGDQNWFRILFWACYSQNHPYNTSTPQTQSLAALRV